MHRRFIIAPAAALTLALAGCPGEPGPQPSVPTIAPSFTPASPLAPEGHYADVGIEIFGGTLFVEVKNTEGAPIEGAVVKLYGPTLATAPVDANGQVTLAPLAEGAGYRLIVQAEGYASLQVGNIEIKKETVVSERSRLSPGASLSGTVLASGKPVEGAVVSDGLNSTLTDAAGAYTLRGVAPGAVTLTVGKPRHQQASRQVNVSERGATKLDLDLQPASPVAYFDGSLSGMATSSFTGLQSQLQSQGWTLSQAPPASEGTWVLISPSTALSTDTIERLTAFVAQGGKLVILGEWGGFSRFSNPSANQLAHALGLHFNPDLVRDPGAEHNQEWLTIRSFQPNTPATAGVSSVQLYQSCSLFSLPPMQALAQTPKSAYRVQNNAAAGPHAVVAGGPYKGGKAIALGDSSAFSDADTDGDGTPNVKEADNAKLITQLFDW